MGQEPVTPNAIKLNALLPRNWERVYGYDGQQAWLSAHWEPAGDEAMCDDGLMSGTANWHFYQWLEFEVIKLDQVRLALAGTKEGQWELGSSETKATHCYLFNLETREIWIAPILEASRYMRQNLKNPPPQIEIDNVDWAKFRDNMNRRQLERMKWLNARVGCPACSLAGWLLQRDGGFDLCPICKGEKFILPEEIPNDFKRYPPSGSEEDLPGPRPDDGPIG